MEVDVDEKKLALENEGALTRAWLGHPLAERYLEELESQETGALTLLLDRSPTNIETLIGHFELVGFLRAIRHAKRKLQERADEIEDELKNLQ
jgi:hypothetical protein